MERVGASIAGSVPEEESDKLKEKVNELKTKFTEISEKARDRNVRLNEATVLSKAYLERSDEFKTWLQECESKLFNSDTDNLPLHKDEITHTIKDIKVRFFLGLFLLRKYFQ